MRKISLILGSLAVATFFMLNQVHAATVVPVASNVQILNGYYDINLGINYATTSDIIPQFSYDDAAAAMTKISAALGDAWDFIGWYMLPLTDYWDSVHYAAASHNVGGEWQVYYDGGGINLQLQDWLYMNNSPNNWVTADLKYLGPAVPLPGALWLLGSGLIGLVGIRKKIKT